MRRPALRASALAAALALLGACRDTPTAALPAAAPTPANDARAALHCAVQVQARTLACQAPAGPRGIRSNVLLGGQGLNVRLTSTNVVFNNGVMTADVTLQNLLDQPMGTNGTDTTGSRIFFNSGPTATQGSGTVTVMTDSTGTFLHVGQPYYAYPGAIAPRGVSAPVQWGFQIDPGVIAFEFTVYVDTQLPGEGSILHWRPERGTQVYSGIFYGIWAASAHDVFAVSDGAVVHYDGNYWRAMDAGPCGCGLYAVGGSSGTDVWAVGGGGLALHWTGGAWQQDPDEALGVDDLYGVWAGSSSDVWVVGAAGAMVHYDGTGWTRAETLLEAPLYGVWGSGSNDVWAVGENGTVVHWDGASVAVSQPAAISGTATLNAVWGTGPNDVWAAGGEDGISGVLYHYDGTAWSEVTDPLVAENAIYSGWSAGAGDVWVVSGGNTLHWDGSAWSVEPVGSGAPLYGITGAGTTPYAAGDFGTLARRTGGSWQTMSVVEVDNVYGIWGSSASDVWAVGGTTLVHGDGTGAWSSQPTPDGETMFGVWGSGASDVWAVGTNGAVLHDGGGGWTEVHNDPSLTLNAVWGSSATDVWAAGDAGALLHWDGGAWTGSTLGTASFYALWGSSATNLFAVADDGSIQRWTGTAWGLMNSGTAEQLYAVWGSGPNDVYAAGSNGTLLHFDGNGSGDWSPVATPADPALPIYAVWGSGPNDVFASVNAGTALMHWDGSSWRMMVPFSSNADIEFYALWGSGPRDVYVGGDWGTIVHGKR